MRHIDESRYLERSDYFRATNRLRCLIYSVASAAKRNDAYSSLFSSILGALFFHTVRKRLLGQMESRCYCLQASSCHNDSVISKVIIMYLRTRKPEPSVKGSLRYGSQAKPASFINARNYERPCSCGSRRACDPSRGQKTYAR